LGDDQAAQSLNLYGWALTLQGQTEAAEATLYYAAQLAEGYNQPGLQATSYHLLAQLWDLRGDYTHMERALDRALALVEDTPRLRWMVIWGLIHQAYVDMRWNQLDRAGQRLQKLDRELARRKALISHRLSVQVGLGLLAMFRDDLEQATHYFELALADFKNLYASNYVVVHLSRARINRKYGRLEAAQQDIMQAMSFAGERGMLADYISAVVETTRFDRATDQPPYMVHLLQQTEAMATRAGLLPARLSVRLALKRVFAQGEAREEAVWYQRLARADRDAIAASIPDPADRTAYLSRRDLKVL
jgi:tetratricopeptide (TPR) repeat protein